MQSNKNITTAFSPEKHSLNNLLVITFAKNRTHTYPLAVSIARGAFKYAETEIDKQTIHMAVFSATKKDVNRALALTGYLFGHRDVGIFIKGRFIADRHKIIPTLKCYANAIKCADYKAHCQLVIDDPFSEKYHSSGLSLQITLSKEKQKPQIIQRYLFPCKYLHLYFKFQKDHPSLPENQIQAAGIERSCDWCPNFQPSAFQKLPSKIVFPNGNVLIEN